MDNIEITPISWQELREKGLLWAINTNLQMFGMILVAELDEEGDITNVYPARTNATGFPPDINKEGYQKIQNFVKEG